MRQSVVIGLGGAVGGIARWSIGELIRTPPAGFPWATVLVNLAGCIAIGVASRRWRPGSARWAFGVTGVLGGFTTFSTFANEVREFLAAGRPVTALAVVTMTLVGGVAAVAVARAGVRQAAPEER